jgi:hypothetical protein
MSPRKKLPHGWMGKGPRRFLRALGAKFEQVIEVGAWQGKGTLQLVSKNAGCIHCVDTWAGTPEDPEQHQLYQEHAGDVAHRAFRKNLAAYIARDRVKLYRMTSLEGAQVLLDRYGPGSFGAVFIDADHRYEAVRDDIAAYAPLIAEGGIISGHDYDWDGVKQAVDEAFGGKMQRGPGSIWWVPA